MGVALSKILTSKEVSLEVFSGKVIAVDAMNMLYQFITTIRQQDGTPLKDSSGNITSHLTGLFSRCTKLMEKNIRLVFVFDGEASELKKKERERREKLKEEAHSKLIEAKKERDLAEMKRLSQRTARITSQMIAESKELLKGLGIPCVQAKSEGEAQAAYMVLKGDCDYVASQDFDCLIYGAPQFVKNLSISHKKKKINVLTYEQVKPEVYNLSNVLKHLELSLNQLRALAILIGTDFNVGGVKGLGPKKALKLVHECGENLEEIFSKANYNEFFQTPWQEVYELISNMPIYEDYVLEWGDVNKEEVIRILVDEHDFSKERVENKLEELEKQKTKSQQTSLGKFF